MAPRYKLKPRFRRYHRSHPTIIVDHKPMSLYTVNLKRCSIKRTTQTHHRFICSNYYTHYHKYNSFIHPSQHGPLGLLLC